VKRTNILVAIVTLLLSLVSTTNLNARWQPPEWKKSPVFKRTDLNNLPSGQYIYLVKKGDCLIKIAHRFGFGLQELCEMNQMTKTSLIFPNQEIALMWVSPQDRYDAGLYYYDLALQISVFGLPNKNGNLNYENEKIQTVKLFQARANNSFQGKFSYNSSYNNANNNERPFWLDAIMNAEQYRYQFLSRTKK